MNSDTGNGLAVPNKLFIKLFALIKISITTIIISQHLYKLLDGVNKVFVNQCLRSMVPGLILSSAYTRHGVSRVLSVST